MSVEFSIRSFGHPLTILALRRRLARSQWFDATQMQDLQCRQLRRMIEHACREVPYYQHCFRRLGLIPSDIRSPSDLARLPILTKADIRQHAQAMRARESLRTPCAVAETSGTSGEPVRIYMSRRAQALEFNYYWRHWNWAGYRLGDRFLEFSSHFFLMRPDLRRSLTHVDRVTGRLLFNSLSLSDESLPAVMHLIRSCRPRFIKGTASVLHTFAWLVQQAGIRDIAFRGIFSTGEMLLPAQRALIERNLHGKCYDSYGHMERTVAISECPHGRLHVNADFGILEALVEDGRYPHTAGKDRDGVVYARIVGTSLYNDVMPLIRYDTGDTVEIGRLSEACSCGRVGMPVVRRILGRGNDVVCTPEGQFIPTLFIVFDTFAEVLTGQIIQDAIDHLCIRVVPGEGWADAVRDRMLTSVRRFVGDGMRLDVQVLAPEQWPSVGSGKFRVVISQIAENPLSMAGVPAWPQVAETTMKH